MYISYETRLKEWNKRYGNLGTRLLKMPLEKLAVFLGLDQMNHGKLQTLDDLVNTSRAAIQRINPGLLVFLERTSLIPLPTKREKITLVNWNEMLKAANDNPVTTLTDLYMNHLERRTECSLPCQICNGYLYLYGKLIRMIMSERISCFDEEAISFIMERRKIRRALCVMGVLDGDYSVHDVINRVGNFLKIPTEKVGISGKIACFKNPF